MSRLVRTSLLALAAASVLAAPAAAHTELTTTAPKDGARLKRPPSVARAAFTQPIRSGELRVLRGGEQVSRGTGRRDPGDVTAVVARLPEELEGGRYTARWTIVGSDGHTQDGSWRFRVAATPTSTPEPTPEPTAAASAEPVSPEPASAVQEDDGGSGTLVAVAIAAAVFLGGGVLLARRR